MGILRMFITQNIDGLHGKAENQSLIEIHGNRTKIRCVECSLRLRRSEFQEKAIPPTCSECGGLVEGNGAMFGEPIPPEWLRGWKEETVRCDCMLLIETSGTVYPAASLPQQMKT